MRDDEALEFAETTIKSFDNNDDLKFYCKRYMYDILSNTENYKDFIDYYLVTLYPFVDFNNSTWELIIDGQIDHKIMSIDSFKSTFEVDKDYQFFLDFILINNEELFKKVLYNIYILSSQILVEYETDSYENDDFTELNFGENQ